LQLEFIFDHQILPKKHFGPIKMVRKLKYHEQKLLKKYVLAGGMGN